MAGPNQENLASMLAASVRAHGDRPLFGTRSPGGWSWISYGEFSRRVDALRAGLASLGVPRGGHVAVISRNRVEWAVGCYAAAGLGAVYVPMYEPQAERDWKLILSDSRATVCLVSGAAVGPRLASVLREVPTVEHVVDFDAPADDPRGYLGLLAWGGAHPLEVVTPEEAEVAELVYTSGTTGRPKGVCLTHSNIVSNVRAGTQVIPVSPDDRSLAFLPWAHVFGGDELHGMISFGGSMAVVDKVDAIVPSLPEVQPTIFFSVPRVWNQIHQSVRGELSKLPRFVRATVERGLHARGRRVRGERVSPLDAAAMVLADRLVLERVRAHLGGRMCYAVCSAAALAPEVAELVQALGVTLLEAYGLTESSACATMDRPGKHRPGSVGQAIPGVRIALDTSVPAAQEGEGEILIYGHGVMAGYHNLPEETAKALTPDGGLRTGDLGRLDEEGFLYVTGRAKELYKLENGKYVAPVALEEQLMLSPYVEQALVYGTDRPYNVALIVAHRERLVQWAHEHRRGDLPVGQLLTSPEVRSLFEEEIDARSRGFRRYERIEDFALIDEPFSIGNALLTPTLKVRRREVLRRYLPRLEALYGAPSPRPPRHAPDRAP